MPRLALTTGNGAMNGARLMPHATIAARPIWPPTATAPAMRKASWRRTSAKVVADARNMVMKNVIKLIIAKFAAIASMAISSGLFTTMQRW